MSKLSIRIMLESGTEFTIKCEKFTLKKNGLGEITGYEIEGISENKPIYLNFDKIAAIVRTVSDE